VGHSSKLSGQKGCSLCKPQKLKRRGQAARQPVATLRFVGRRHRVSRHDVRGGID